MKAKYWKVYREPGPMDRFPDHKWWVYMQADGMTSLERKFETKAEADEYLAEMEEYEKERYDG